MNWLDVGILVLSLGVILTGAELFTNGVEWLGKKLNLSEGAVGSVLAAVGTALPETMIPIIAIVFTGGQGSLEVGIGAILGAPFMLGTLGFFITGVAGVVFKINNTRRREMAIDHHVLQRDLRFFLIVFTIAILTAFIRISAVRLVMAAFLISAYIYYVYRTVTSGKSSNGNLNPLYFARKSFNPSMLQVILQLAIALAGIVLGAKFFVGGVEDLAKTLGINPLILSLLITPIATELPEKFNSVIWVRQGKDTLALGNITGAMVFQSSIIPAIGIILTPWKLTLPALVSASIAITSALVVFLYSRWTGRLKPVMLLSGGFYYLIFLIFVLTTQTA